MKGKKLIISFFVILMFLSFPLTFSESVVFSETANYVQYAQIQRDTKQLEYELATQKLVETVRTYIFQIGKSSKLSPSLLVKKCDQHEIDLKLVLAQGHLESQFGTTGRAKFTNSVFNVGALDDGTTVPGNIYTHPNYSVEPYIQLLKSQYLVKGKTEDDLLYGKFVNKSGKRYATERAYEKRLIKIIDDMNPVIDSLILIRKQLDSTINYYDEIIQYDKQLLAEL